jgi:hypothetical protein
VIELRREASRCALPRSLMTDSRRAAVSVSSSVTAFLRYVERRRRRDAFGAVLLWVVSLMGETNDMGWYWNGWIGVGEDIVAL